MKLKNWLNEGRGRCTALALHLGVTRGRISQMADEGVPKKYLLKVRNFTGGQVSLEEMVASVTEAAVSQ